MTERALTDCRREWNRAHVRMVLPIVTDPIGSRPIGLGTDKTNAIRAVLDMNGDNNDRNTLNELWRRQYQATTGWVDLAQASRDDYTQCSKELLKIPGKMR